MDYESICGSLQTVRTARMFYEYGKLDRLLEQNITNSEYDLYEIYYELLYAACDYPTKKPIWSWLQRATCISCPCSPAPQTQRAGNRMRWKSAMRRIRRCCPS